MKIYKDKVISLLEAVLAIKPDAQAQISGDDLSTIVWFDGNPTNITNEAIQTKYDELIVAEDAAVAQRPAKKASGKQKLKDLGLDDDEIKALTGV